MSKRAHKISLAALLSLALVFVLDQIQTDGMEGWFYNLRVKTNLATQADPRIVLVRFDRKTDEALGRINWPLPGDVHLRLAQALDRASPLAVGYFLPLDDAEVDKDPAMKDWLNFAGKRSNFLFARQYDHLAEASPSNPRWADAVRSFPRSTTWDLVSFAQDRVTRRALLFQSSQPTIATAIAQLASDRPLTPQTLNNLFKTGAFDAHYTHINYAGSSKEPQGVFPEFSAIDLLQGAIPLESLKGKIILVGRFNLQWRSDTLFSPFSRGNSENALLTINAHIVNTVLQNNGIAPARPLLNGTLALLLTVAVASAALLLSPARGLAFALGSFFLYGLVVSLFFWMGHTWIYASKALLGSFIAYYVLIPYRFIQEYRHRFSLQKQHAQLTQADQLKSNFVSMMSHHLKTPIARISGLADLMCHKGSLNEDQIKAAQEIQTSTEELSRFVSSLLGLAKIENADLKLNRQSKDINKIIENAASRFRFNAQNKNIKVRLDLEPMFSVKVDNDLVYQSVCNLLDNALKYSQPNTEVTVQSREENGSVVVRVKDQGLGMSQEERSQLFQKFHRGTSDQVQSVQGTGLGLFLVKYFVELHQGKIEVQSAPGLGSEFSIHLPIEGEL